MADIEYNLLIIDDEIEITKSLLRQFRKRYKVFTATNANDAFPILEKENIQVVLSDQRMPGLTGIDFFSKIKDKYPDALKLILTGYSDIEAVIGAINDGQVFRYITKPWNPAELDAAIREAFEKYELITKNRRLMRSLEEANAVLEQKVKVRTHTLEKANQILRNLNLEKNKFMGIVAHDLRNPIGAIQSFSGLLNDEFDEFGKEDKIKFIGIINERSGFALNLIENFLDASKIEAGVFDLKKYQYDFVSFMKETIGHINSYAEEKSQVIFFESTQEKIELLFDKDKMEQVFSNIISNAIKYSQPGKNIWIDITSNEEKVVCKIRDEGQGIPEDEILNIYNPYVTTSVKATAGEKSHGLGLAIVKKIVDAHEGEITVESEPGKGTIFTVCIPFLKEK